MSMDLEFITDMYIPVVMIACLVIGVILKKWYPLDNKWIPTILVAVGAILGCVANGGIALDSVVAGAVTGLASTGFHQAFKQLLKLDVPESTEASCLDKETAESLIQADMDAVEKEPHGRTFVSPICLIQADMDAAEKERAEAEESEKAEG